MHRSSLGFGALAGIITSLAVMALLYLGQQIAGFAFVPFDLFDWLARVLPGDLITLGIDLIVNIVGFFGLGATDTAAKTIEQLMALLLFAGAGALFGLAIAWITRPRAPGSEGTGLGIGAIAGSVALLIVLIVEYSLDGAELSFGGILWLAAVFVGWGAFLGRLLSPQVEASADEELHSDRRQMLLKLIGGSAGIAITAWGLGSLFGAPDEDTGAARPLVDASVTPSTPVLTPTPVGEAVAPDEAPTPTQQLAAEATVRERIAPAPGTRDELTSNEDFYRIDINIRSPVLHEDEWVLATGGLFADSRDLSLDDLMAFPSATQPITLSCISNRIGGDLIGTSNWSGARLRDVIESLGIQPEARALVLTAADGFHETIVMKDMLDPRTLLVYGMNGETLPVDHGFPLRIYIPNRYGMKQPKWIVGMTAVPEEEDGYWVKRGWSREARPQIVSVIDSVALDQPTPDGLIPIGGIAWAGDRGIQKVEVQVDDEPWVQASLLTPPLSPLTWVQWRYDWPVQSGRHTIRVRAIDGTGELQIEEQSGVRPDGATGYHQERVSVS
ncbi:MAG: molybdopterin-dependent oxidoreductase [Chloroflexota bacterium]|nr:MAG: molybdopterin-dependent oxidoreductase [Chloroflexota bacterium]